MQKSTANPTLLDKESLFVYESTKAVCARCKYNYVHFVCDDICHGTFFAFQKFHTLLI